MAADGCPYGFLAPTETIADGAIGGDVEEEALARIDEERMLGMLRRLSEDQQSVHFSMVFRHPERTLTGEEVEQAVRSVVEGCEARFHAKLRG